jgi:GntR family transcriptional regulator
MKTVLPAYYQIRETIKGWIYNEEYKPGEKIPSEKDLVEIFKVNRLTVRHAISQLVQGGFLEIHKGEGTFIPKNVNLTNRLRLESSGYLGDLNLMDKFKSKFVKVNTIQASNVVKEKLGLKNNDEVVQIKRVRVMKHNIPWYTINYLPMDIGIRVMEWQKELFKKPLVKVMEDLGFKIVEAFQVIHASLADSETAKFLNISAGAPVLVVERIMYGKNKKILDWVQSFYSADKCEYITRLKDFGKKTGHHWGSVEEEK